jgi:ABC-type histidine transport system ATPase subunit
MPEFNFQIMMFDRLSYALDPEMIGDVQDFMVNLLIEAMVMSLVRNRLCQKSDESGSVQQQGKNKKTPSQMSFSILSRFTDLRI